MGGRSRRICRLDGESHRTTGGSNPIFGLRLAHSWSRNLASDTGGVFCPSTSKETRPPSKLTLMIWNSCGRGIRHYSCDELTSVVVVRALLMLSVVCQILEAQVLLP